MTDDSMSMCPMCMPCLSSVAVANRDYDYRLHLHCRTYTVHCCLYAVHCGTVAARLAALYVVRQDRRQGYMYIMLIGDRSYVVLPPPPPPRACACVYVCACTPRPRGPAARHMLQTYTTHTLHSTTTLTN